jgi:adenylate cyclase
MTGSGASQPPLPPFHSSLLVKLAGWTLVGSEDDDEALAKATLTLGTTVIVAVSSVWVITYLVIGRPLAAAIPFSYQVLSLGVLWGLRRGSVQLVAARWIESAVMLALPFLLHASLGGYVGSGGVAAWALCTPLLAYLYGSSPGRWMAGFGVLAIIAALLEAPLAEAVAPMPSGLRSAFFAINLVGVGAVIHFGISYAIAERERRRAELSEANRRIEAERNRADDLLMSIMPSDVARRLKEGERRIADRVPAATVLAADIAGFTALADRTPPAELVDMIDQVWTRFDRMVDERGLEKIKSVGDSYIVVGGLDPSRGDQMEAIMELALAMAEPQPIADGEPIMMRVGVAHGPIVVGVIGEVRPAFGLWGDTVNTASRMESTGVPGRVQVTEQVWERVGRRFESELRGSVEVKGKGPMRTYLVVGPKTGSAEPVPT